jgi:hypothetical protein
MYADVLREPIRTDLHRLKELLEQDLIRMNRRHGRGKVVERYVGLQRRVLRADIRRFISTPP